MENIKMESEPSCSSGADTNKRNALEPIKNENGDDVCDEYTEKMNTFACNADDNIMKIKNEPLEAFVDDNNAQNTLPHIKNENEICDERINVFKCNTDENNIKIKTEPSSTFIKDNNTQNTIKQEDIDDQVQDENTERLDVLEHHISENKNDFDIPNIPEDYKATYQAYINKVTALASIPIKDSVTAEHIKNFKHFNLRYYEDRYCINFALEEAGYNDVLIRIHSNKLFLISLASGNDLIRCDRNITGINFMVNNKDRSDVKLSGKKKKGAKVIEPHTILCQVKCEGVAKMFNIRAGVPGRILEINEHIKKDPNLLRTDPRGYGYLAVVAPKGHPSDYEQVMDNLKLLSQDEYIKHLSQRTS